MARIYLASSWRNIEQAFLLNAMKVWGHSVYDFKSSEPMEGGGPRPTAFSWAELDPNWKNWTPTEYREKLLGSQRAASGYLGDLRGMEWADTCVLLMPCGRSAHIEAGYMKGRGKRLIIHYPANGTEGFEPDLMYLLADHITIGAPELLSALGEM